MSTTQPGIGASSIGGGEGGKAPTAMWEVHTARAAFDVARDRIAIIGGVEDNAASSFTWEMDRATGGYPAFDVRFSVPNVSASYKADVISFFTQTSAVDSAPSDRMCLEGWSDGAYISVACAPHGGTFPSLVAELERVLRNPAALALRLRTDSGESLRPPSIFPSVYLTSSSPTAANRRGRDERL